MFPKDSEPIPLEGFTDREIRVAQLAADLAEKRMRDEFYKSIGKTFVNRIFVWIGVAVVAFAAGKGWLFPFEK